jgi:hypothetical protein
MRMQSDNIMCAPQAPGNNSMIDGLLELVRNLSDVFHRPNGGTVCSEIDSSGATNVKTHQSQLMSVLDEAFDEAFDHIDQRGVSSDSLPKNWLSIPIFPVTFSAPSHLNPWPGCCVPNADVPTNKSGLSFWKISGWNPLLTYFSNPNLDPFRTTVTSLPEQVCDKWRVKDLMEKEPGSLTMIRSSSKPSWTPLPFASLSAPLPDLLSLPHAEGTSTERLAEMSIMAFGNNSTELSAEDRRAELGRYAGRETRETSET